MAFLTALSCIQAWEPAPEDEGGDHPVLGAEELEDLLTGAGEVSEEGEEVGRHPTAGIGQPGEGPTCFTT